MAVRGIRGAGLRRARRGGPLALATLLYAAAAVAATWPAVGSFRSAFIADGAPGFGEAAAGDHLQNVYRFWLVGHQLARLEPPWRDPYSFQPLVEPQLALGGWPFGLVFWPLERALGAAPAWNVLLLAGVVGGGLLTFGWLRSLALPPPAAVLGGLAFAIAPYRLEQSGGHLLGWVALLVPLALLALERARSAGTRRAAHAWGALAALALVSVPLSGQVHLALGVVPFTVAYAAVRLRRLPLLWGVVGAVGAAAVGLAIRYTLIAGSIEAGGRSLAEVELFQASWRDLVSRSERTGSEQFVHVGWLTPALALAGLAILLRRRRGLAAVLGLGALVPVLLAVGTHLPTYSLLYDALPPFRFPRVPARLMPIADLALAGLAAVAVAAIIGRMRVPILAAALLTVLVAADLTVQPLRASPADPGNVYAEARSQPPGRTLELPLFEPGIHFGSVYNYYTLWARSERPGGYSTLAPPAAFDFFFRLNRLSCGVWLPGDAAELRSLGVRAIAFHTGLYGQSATPGAWFAWRALMREGYRPTAREGAVTLLARASSPPASAPVPEPPHGTPVLCEGWRAATMRERQAPLWVWGGGRVELELSAARATAASLSVDGRAPRAFRVDGAATVSARLRGARWHVLLLEVPVLSGEPPRGLRLVRLER